MKVIVAEFNFLGEGGIEILLKPHLHLIEFPHHSPVQQVESFFLYRGVDALGPQVPVF